MTAHLIMLRTDGSLSSYDVLEDSDVFDTAKDLLVKSQQTEMVELVHSRTLQMVAELKGHKLLQMVTDEEGRLRPLPANPVASYLYDPTGNGVICGDVVFAYEDRGAIGVMVGLIDARYRLVLSNLRMIVERLTPAVRAHYDALAEQAPTIQVLAGQDAQRALRNMGWSSF